jgi:hypothetical protein
VEIRFAALIGNQEKLARKIKDIGGKIEYLEKGLLNIFGHRVAKLQSRLSEYI